MTIINFITHCYYGTLPLHFNMTIGIALLALFVSFLAFIVSYLMLRLVLMDKEKVRINAKLLIWSFNLGLYYDKDFGNRNYNKRFLFGITNWSTYYNNKDYLKLLLTGGGKNMRGDEVGLTQNEFVTCSSGIRKHMDRLFNELDASLEKDLDSERIEKIDKCVNNIRCHILLENSMYHGTFNIIKLIYWPSFLLKRILGISKIDVC